MYKYYIIAVILGIICKVYDDLNDTDIFEYFNLQEYKEYLNEFLKSLFVFIFSILSINFNFFYIWFVSFNSILYFVKRDEYKAYETMALLSFTILIPFLNWNNILNWSNNDRNIQKIILLSLTSCIWEYFTINFEYSNKKLITRSFYSIILILLLFINNNFTFLSKDIIIILLFSIAYYLTSCCFQYILITRDNHLLQYNKIVKEELGVKEELVVKEEVEKEIEKKVKKSKKIRK